MVSNSSISKIASLTFKFLFTSFISSLPLYNERKHGNKKQILSNRRKYLPMRFFLSMYNETRRYRKYSQGYCLQSKISLYKTLDILAEGEKGINNYLGTKLYSSAKTDKATWRQKGDLWEYQDGSYRPGHTESTLDFIRLLHTPLRKCVRYETTKRNLKNWAETLIYCPDQKLAALEGE